jgi:hypothetical protein
MLACAASTSRIFVGPHELHLLLERAHGALRHGAHDLRLELVARRLERERELLGLDLAQQPLERLVVEPREVLEHEHEVLDLLDERRVALAHPLEQLLLERGRHQVEHRGHRRRPAGRAHPLREVEVGLARQRALDELQHLGADLLHLGHAVQHVAAERAGELAQHGRRLRGVEVREHERRGLRVLAAQRRRELLRVGLAQAREPGGVGQLRGDAAQDGVGLRAARRRARARRARTRAARGQRLDAERGLEVLGEHGVGRRRVDALHLRDLVRELLGLVGGERAGDPRGGVGPTAMQTMAIFWRR